MSRRIMVVLIAAAAALLLATGAIAALLITQDDDDDSGASGEAGTGKGYLGLTVTAVPPQGLRVAGVDAEGPAAKAGVQAGDLLRSVDGQVVRTPEQLRNAIEPKAPGTQVSLTYERGDRELQATVKLGESPPNVQLEATPAPQGNQGGNRGLAPNAANRGQLGVQVQTITPQLKERYSLTRDSGVVIVQVQPNSGAARADLRAGDIITSINGREVATERDVAQQLANASTGQRVSLGILRGSEQLTIDATLTSVQAIPGFDRLPLALQERLRELAESGNYTLEQLQRLASGENNLAMGTVKSISDTSLTVTRLDNNLQPNGDVTFTLNDRTQYRQGNDTLSRDDIKVGSTVMVISLDGQTALGIFVFQR